jgi:hypothetical protein
MMKMTRPGYDQSRSEVNEGFERRIRTAALPKDVRASFGGIQIGVN